MSRSSKPVRRRMKSSMRTNQTRTPARFSGYQTRGSFHGPSSGNKCHFAAARKILNSRCIKRQRLAATLQLAKERDSEENYETRRERHGLRDRKPFYPPLVAAALLLRGQVQEWELQELQHFNETHNRFTDNGSEFSQDRRKQYHKSSHHIPSPFSVFAAPKLAQPHRSNRPNLLPQISIADGKTEG
eukprot:1072705-Rhodomonas_salina.2